MKNIIYGEEPYGAHDRLLFVTALYSKDVFYNIFLANTIANFVYGNSQIYIL